MSENFMNKNCSSNITELINLELLLDYEQDDSLTGLNNPIISATFLVIGGFATLFLLLVIVIHLKYLKFKQKVYGVIFSSVLCEYFFCVIYLIHGIDYLTFKTLEKSDVACQVFSFCGNFLIGSLISYNIILIVNIILKRIPALRTPKKESFKEERIRSYFNIKNFRFLWTHILSFAIGLLNAGYTYISDNLGRLQTGTCFLKDNPNDFIYINVAGFCIYFILSIIYLIYDKILKKNFHEDFPILKNFVFYLLFTSFGWGLWLFALIDKWNDDVVNCISISGGLLIFLAISYYRINSGYVKSILKQESSNRLIAAIMILLCLDNKADPDLYEFRSTINIKDDDLLI